MADRNLIAFAGAAFILKMKGIPGFSHGDNRSFQNICVKWGNTTFYLFSWKVLLHVGTSAGKPLSSSYKITQKTEDAWKPQSRALLGDPVFLIRVPRMDFPERGPLRLALREMRLKWWGLQQRRRCEKAGDPWTAWSHPGSDRNSPERAPTLIHDCWLEKHRQILKSCVKERPHLPGMKMYPGEDTVCQGETGAPEGQQPWDTHARTGTSQGTMAMANCTRNTPERLGTGSAL